MTSNLYLSAYWFDQRLEWEPSNFNGLNEIFVQANKLWLPDFAVINTAGTNVFIQINDSNLALINSDGYIFLLISVTALQTRCKINVYKFPFDTQNCSIVIGSWQLDTTRIDFSSDDTKINTDDYVQSAVWSLKKIDVKSSFTNSRYPADELSQNEDIIYNLIIERRPLYYMQTFILCFILNIATLLAFFVSNAIVVQVNLCNLKLIIIRFNKN